MTRFACFALLAACAAAPRPTLSNSGPPARYTLDPLTLDGGEGRHSASHSSTSVSGTLELADQRATLHLALETFRSHVRCPPAWRDGTVRTVQACASDDAEDTTTTARRSLSGDVRPDAGALLLTLRDGERRLALRCQQAQPGLQCSVTSSTLFSSIGEQPDQLRFSLSSPPRPPARAARTAAR